MSDPNSYGGNATWQRPEDLVGTILDERFRVMSLMGDGGMGSVYLAEHVTLRKRVAIKVLKPSCAASRPTSIASCRKRERPR